MAIRQQPTGWTPLEWTSWAMNAAADRLQKTAWHDPHLAYSHVGETLWWAIKLSDLLKDAYGSNEYSQMASADKVDDHLLGLRHARNRFSHDPLVTEFVELGFVMETSHTPSTSYWHWTHLSQPQNQRWITQWEAYERVIADHLVQSTLTHTLTFLRFHALTKAGHS